MSAVPAERVALATAYRMALHDVQCPGRADCLTREPCSWRWVAHQPVPAWLAAVEHLEAHPRDAQGARERLHDGVCSPDCRSRADHARRTQTVPVRALRKVLRDSPVILLGQDVDTPPCSG